MSGNKKDITLNSYKQLFESLYPELYEFAYKYLNDFEASKDVVQEVFVQVWEDRVAFENENHRTGYFYKAIKNKCLDCLKK